jgi:hypothetical protein
VSLHVPYTLVGRLLHRVAFASPVVQLTAAQLERAAFGTAYGPFTAARPVFVTSLPRAGTALLLDALDRLPATSTQTSQDLPFVMAPLLWARLRGGVKPSIPANSLLPGDTEHGPETCEEVFWRTSWPEKYTSSRIPLWGEEDFKPAARAFLSEHM